MADGESRGWWMSNRLLNSKFELSSAESPHTVWCPDFDFSANDLIDLRILDT